MTGEALREEIRRAAEERAKRVLAEARGTADTILAEAEGEAKEILDRRVEDARKQMEQLEKSEAAKARMECNRLALNLQSRYVEEAFIEAESRVSSLPTRDPALYRRVLTDFVTEALERLGGTGLVVVARDPDRALVEDMLRRLGREAEAGGRTLSFSVSGESLNATGGVLLHTEDKRTYYVNTFESRFLKSRDELRAKVVDALLGVEVGRSDK